MRQGIEALLEGVPLEDLRRAADLLSHRYRNEVLDGGLHLSGDLAARAYLATRLPATYAAVAAAMAAVAERMEEWTPRTLLDVGAGPGTALWAASGTWPSVERATMVEASAPIAEVGSTLARLSAVAADWIAADIRKGLPRLPTADLVTLSYVLDELPPDEIGPLVDRLWSLAGNTLLVVEPGTPAGWRRILAVRDRLVRLGAGIAAPCAHAAACPIVAPDWCHFSQRLARSRHHRLVKRGDVPWEDEKFIYVAASRTAGSAPLGRVLAPPRAASGAVRLKLCLDNGTAEERLVTRRQGPAYKVARRLDWGDALEAQDGS